MSYHYLIEKPRLFTEDGFKMLIAIRDNARKLIDVAGCVRMDKAMGRVSGDSWQMLACIDYLVELGELREIAPIDSVAEQSRIFVRVGDCS